MFFHDIGKPACYIRRYSKIAKRDIDSFFNHNLMSEKIADRVLPLLDFDKNQQEIMKLLIKEHDIFMFIKLQDDYNKHHKTLTFQLIKDYVKKYSEYGNGIEIFKLLLKVGRADSLAQNPEMTKSSFDLLDAMEKMLEDYEKDIILGNREDNI